jgi:hypothetical protein
MYVEYETKYLFSAAEEEEYIIMSIIVSCVLSG